MDNQRTAQCSVVEDRVVKESIDECMYQLGNEKITHTEYNNLIQQQPKEIVDEVIHRIIEHRPKVYDGRGLSCSGLYC